MHNYPLKIQVEKNFISEEWTVTQRSFHAHEEYLTGIAFHGELFDLIWARFVYRPTPDFVEYSQPAIYVCFFLSNWSSDSVKGPI